MDGRNSEEKFYRISHNTQERTDEIAGIGNHHKAKFWEYSPRIARRWNLDPVDQISISNYSVNRLNSIIYNDPIGDDLTNPRNGKPFKFDLNRASIFSYETNPKIKKVRDEDLYKKATPSNLFGETPRNRDSPEGTWYAYKIYLSLTPPKQISSTLLMKLLKH